VQIKRGVKGNPMFASAQSKTEAPVARQIAQRDRSAPGEFDPDQRRIATRRLDCAPPSHRDAHPRSYGKGPAMVEPLNLERSAEPPIDVAAPSKPVGGRPRKIKAPVAAALDTSGGKKNGSREASRRGTLRALVADGSLQL
jgi:hypothetical protein